MFVKSTPKIKCYIHRSHSCCPKEDNPEKLFISSIILHSSIIIDPGALVCISLHRSDFVTYKNSKMKIKDLSSLNQVVGEGVISWSLQDVNGELDQLELFGYHMPNAEVCFLIPQVLIKTIGGHALQTANEINVVLNNGNNICAQFCLQSNLPMIPLTIENGRKHYFWNKAFDFSVDSFCNINALKSILHQLNTNLSASQKELLLWHQQLSHA
jgi:hypothetical protein